MPRATEWLVRPRVCICVLTVPKILRRSDPSDVLLADFRHHRHRGALMLLKVVLVSAGVILNKRSVFLFVNYCIRWSFFTINNKSIQKWHCDGALVSAIPPTAGSIKEQKHLIQGTATREGFVYNKQYNIHRDISGQIAKAFKA